jgi:RNA polymerase sigma factor (sigma-70 family)
MASKGLQPVVWHLRRMALLHDGAGLPDSTLLGMFVDQSDAVAFEALLLRHGPMVHGVCKRILGNPHDAQDAAQATFLVLINKAKSVRRRAMIGNWLYGVARQTAIRMRSQNAKRWRREKQVAAMPEPQAKTSETTDDWETLDQELSRLPETYRIAIILCDLEGKTRKQAARQLAWPEGTLSTRLTRGRNMLAKRLAKRGLVLSVEALALALGQNLASASLSPGVVSATVKAASILAAGKVVAAGLISAKVVALTKGTVLSMFLTKVKTKTAVVLVAGILGAGGLAMTQVLLPAPVAAQQAAPKKIPADEPKKPNSQLAAEGAKVRELRKERLDALRKRYDLTKEDYDVGRLTLDPVFSALLDLFHAEFSFCDTDEQRMSICDKRLAIAKEYEKVAEQRNGVGNEKYPMQVVLGFKALRLEIEIEYEQAKAKVASPRKGAPPRFVPGNELQAK